MKEGLDKAQTRWQFQQVFPHTKRLDRERGDNRIRLSARPFCPSQIPALLARGLRLAASAQKGVHGFEMIVVMSTSPHQVVLVVAVVDSFISIDAGNTSVGKLALPVGTLCMTAWKLALRLETCITH